MSIETEFEFHRIIDSFARLDSLALRVRQDVVEIDTGGDEPERIEGISIDVTLCDERVAKRLIGKHRLVPGTERSPLALSRTWCGWLPEASRLLPVSVHLTLVSGR